MGIFDVFTGKSTRDAAAANAAQYNAYKGEALGYLDTALPKSEGAFNSAVGAYAPLAALGQKYGGATNLYMDALGVNGPQGNARATAAFQASPGYQWSVDQASDQAARKAASLGIAGSGNTLSAITDRASNLANQEYGNYLTRLGGFVPQEASAVGGAASGQAAGYGALGNLYQSDAQNRANVAGTAASGIANSNTAAANAEMAGSGQFWNALAHLGSNFLRGALPSGGGGSGEGEGGGG